jgi:hypothetical protein
MVGILSLGDVRNSAPGDLLSECVKSVCFAGPSWREKHRGGQPRESAPAEQIKK